MALTRLKVPEPKETVPLPAKERMVAFRLFKLKLAAAAIDTALLGEKELAVVTCCKVPEVIVVVPL